jgi:lipopolysaccharide export LptBFGC system permease protein LptF
MYLTLYLIAVPFMFLLLMVLNLPVAPQGERSHRIVRALFFVLIGLLLLLAYGASIEHWRATSKEGVRIIEAPRD